MPDRREELDRIAALTLGHYDASAEAFWVGTRDHDVRQNIAALLRHLEGAGPFSILDLGCGPGRDLVTFRDLGHEAIGVDGAARFVEMARAHSGCEVWQQNLLALALPEARFDGIFANAVLQHVPASELPRVLVELRDGAATARRAVQLDSARPRRGRLEQRPLQRLSRARRPGSATAPRPASSSSSTTTGPKAGRASSSRGWRAPGGAATIRRAEPAASGRADAGDAAARQYVERAVDAHQQVDREARKLGERIHRIAVCRVEPADELADEIGEVVLVAVAGGNGPFVG